MAAIDAELEVDAIGRASFLGQTYNARSGKLLNFPLFPRDVIEAATRPGNLSNTVSTYQEVRESENRTSLLNVSASVALSLLGGALNAKGSAAYIDRSDSAEASLAISGIRGITADRPRLEVLDQGLQSSVILTPEKVQQLGATHVVTAICYGASMIGSLSQTNYDLQKSTGVEGRLTLKMLQSFGAFTGAGGDADVSDSNREKISRYELEIHLVGDFLGGMVPVNPVALSMKLAEPAKVLRVQVPVKLTLSPLSFFKGISAEIFSRDLEEAQLLSLMKIYDEMVTLTQNWNYLVGNIAQHGDMSGYTLVDWCTALQKGWGVYYSPGSNAKYIGDLVDGLPHGKGRMTYSDGRVYEGSWFRGDWDGPGNLTKGDTILQSGIFVNSKVEDRAVMINVTVYDGDVPVDSATIAVICHQITPPRQQPIPEMKTLIPAQLQKISNALGWQHGQRFRLHTTWEAPKYISWPDSSERPFSDPTWELYPDEPIPNHFSKEKSSTSVIANGSELESFEYDDNQLMLG
ncbi:MORN repeat domain-containing protein [Purpureocillium lilacinum]|uniref:MORN repeat domain-containing protein n=1 Tax=Purpureocillium lilacinum TaxID=33203 RepID=A0A179FKL5_PURLI|nr:MORN repeat domain-containing protein [Purpureocillium lilacinum]OAQ65549.1 MORN repeat domain-containing protein [Purpureocillium lilacinum]